MATTHERVPFRFLSCPQCRFMICWVNPHLPNFCPECGKRPPEGHWKERVHLRDDEAILTLHNSEQLAGGNYID